MPTARLVTGHASFAAAMAVAPDSLIRQIAAIASPADLDAIAVELARIPHGAGALALLNACRNTRPS